MYNTSSSDQPEGKYRFVYHKLFAKVFHIGLAVMAESQWELGWSKEMKRYYFMDKVLSLSFPVCFVPCIFHKG